MKKNIIAILVILVILVSCKNSSDINEADDQVNTETDLTEIQETVNKDDSKTNKDLEEEPLAEKDRVFNVTAEVESDYEAAVVEILELHISGEFDSLNKLMYKNYEADTVDELSEKYSSGYGAKEISVDIIKSYKSIEALSVDESNIPSGIKEAFDDHQDSTIIFVVFNYTNTDKAIMDDQISQINGAVGQYYVVSKIEDEFLITYN